jgi:hypothetical protein
MMIHVTQAVQGTPLWVWALLAFITVLGLRALRPTSASLQRLVVLPAIFLIWGVQVLLTKFTLTPLSLGTWGLGIVAGTAIGWVLMQRTEVQIDRSAGLVHMPGSMMTLAVSLIIFASKYVFGYMMARWPALGQDPGFIVTNLGISGVFSGMLVGRFASLLRSYNEAPAPSIAA